MAGDSEVAEVFKGDGALALGALGVIPLCIGHGLGLVGVEV